MKLASTGSACDLFHSSSFALFIDKANVPSKGVSTFKTPYVDGVLVARSVSQCFVVGRCACMRSQLLTIEREPSVNFCSIMHIMKSVDR